MECAYTMLYVGEIAENMNSKDLEISRPLRHKMVLEHIGWRVASLQKSQQDTITKMIVHIDKWDQNC